MDEACHTTGVPWGGTSSARAEADGGRGCLWWLAVVQGHKNVSELLVQHGAEVNAMAASGYVPHGPLTHSLTHSRHGAAVRGWVLTAAAGCVFVVQWHGPDVRGCGRAQGGGGAAAGTEGRRERQGQGHARVQGAGQTDSQWMDGGVSVGFAEGCWVGGASQVEKALKEGTEGVEPHKEGVTALMVAALGGHTEVRARAQGGHREREGGGGRAGWG